jgi:hypothetical protein
MTPSPQTDMGTLSSTIPMEPLRAPSTTQELQTLLQQQALLISYLTSQPNLLSSGLAVNPMNPTQTTHLRTSSQSLKQSPVHQEMLPSISIPRRPQATAGLMNISSQPQPGVMPTSKAQNRQATSSRPTPEDAELASEGHGTQSEGEVEITVLDKKRKRKARRQTSSSFDDEPVQMAIRSNPPVRSGIFTDDKASPSKFFVTLDLKNRKELLQIIRVRFYYPYCNYILLVPRDMVELWFCVWSMLTMSY